MERINVKKILQPSNNDGMQSVTHRNGSLSSQFSSVQCCKGDHPGLRNRSID